MDRYRVRQYLLNDVVLDNVLRKCGLDGAEILTVMACAQRPKRRIIDTLTGRHVRIERPRIIDSLLHCMDASIRHVCWHYSKDTTRVTNARHFKGTFEQVWERLDDPTRLWFRDAPLFWPNPDISDQPKWLSAIGAVLDTVPYRLLWTNPSLPEDRDDQDARRRLNLVWRMYFEAFGIPLPEHFPYRG